MSVLGHLMTFVSGHPQRYSLCIRVEFTTYNEWSLVVTTDAKYVRDADGRLVPDCAGFELAAELRAAGFAARGESFGAVVNPNVLATVGN